MITISYPDLAGCVREYLESPDTSAWLRLPGGKYLFVGCRHGKEPYQSDRWEVVVRQMEKETEVSARNQHTGIKILDEDKSSSRAKATQKKERSQA